MYIVTVGHMMSEPHPQLSWQPVSAEEFADWFDNDGRLVREVTMRQRVFEGTCVSAGFPTSFLQSLYVYSITHLYPSLPPPPSPSLPPSPQVLGTHYLELYSDKAQVETDKAIAKEFLNNGQISN